MSFVWGSTPIYLFFWGEFCLTEQDFGWYWCFSLLLTVFLPPLPEVQCANFLDFRLMESMGKSNGKNWSQI